MNNSIISTTKMRTTINMLILSVAIFCVVISGCSGLQGPREETTTTSKPAEPRSSFVPVDNVAMNVRPSVVSIGVRTAPQGQGNGRGTGVGSGVIYSDDGYIITNNHVISGATAIVVALETEEVPANIVAADPETDIAVVKVSRNNLNEANFGSTRDMRAGDPVAAIGSPFGLEQTVTFGIVSAQGRNITIEGEQNNQPVTYTDLIQTDAAINPGNSGGALCNMNSEVIGINTLVISRSGAFNGIGFAIPAEIATDVAQQLIENGRASHPYVGIAGRSVAGGTSPLNSSDASRGVLVVDVDPGSPADRAGLKHGDVITAIGGAQVNDIGDFVAELRKRNVGDKVTVTYIRNGNENKATMSLVEKPD